MAVFFTCIILIGSGLVFVSFLLMLYEKKRLHDYRGDLHEKKDSLITIIEDAEELITEMNRFSEYTVNQIEEKNNNLLQSIAAAEQKIHMLESTGSHNSAQTAAESVYDEASVNKIIDEDKSSRNRKSDALIPESKGKVLAFDLKRREIIRLAKCGINSTEIARLLNCGKGEIELISRMGR